MFVIDAGKAKINKYNAGRKMASLTECWISKASAQQRAGRAGRVKPGHCFRLYSKQLHTDMAPFEIPEMLRSPLEGVILQIKTLRLRGTVAEVFRRAVQPPPDNAVAAAFATLREVTAAVAELTPASKR